MSCGTKFSACVATGRTVLDETYVRCKTCKHKAYRSDMRGVKNCLLCHTPVPAAGPVAGAGGGGGGGARATVVLPLR
jgi:hypothetical protein